MRKLIVSILVLIPACLMAQVNNSLTIIPAPVKLLYSGGSYLVSSQTPVTLNGFPKKSHLASFANKVFTTALTPNKTPAISKTGGGLTLLLDKNASLPSEGYRLTVNNSGIGIVATTEKGAFYGLQTLLQLMPDTVINGTAAIPFVEIEDYPRYAYRGLHLDVGRHMFPVSFIKEYIDLIAQYKLNTFHWHLTEDQGWRIEIKKYPKLTGVGGYRARTLIGSVRNKPQLFDSIPYGGYYTQDEVREVVAYAKSRYVTVIPEIEMPGHSLAALAAYPELACGHNPGPFKTAEKWGIFEDVYCAGKETTFKMLENVLDEVLVLFPSEYIHIGGDESPKARWKGCAFCQKRIKKEKLKDEHELQSYFIQRIEKYLNKKSRQIIGWDEILEGGLAPNATVMSWRGTKGGLAAAQQSHNVIMTPNSHLYFDHQESKLPLEKVYSYNPTPTELTEEQQKYIIGVQANMWTEHMQNIDKVQYMLFPRIYALSEISWTPLQRKNWQDFTQNRVAAHLARLDVTGTTFRVPVPIGAKDTTMTGKEFTLEYKVPVKKARIYYTTNGYPPAAVDHLYSKPIKLTVPAGEERVVKSVVITASGKRSAVTTTVLKGES